MKRQRIRAEILKLRSQRAAFFWGFLMVPLFVMLVAIILGAGPRMPGINGELNGVQPFHAAARALNIGGNPIAQLFYAVGAAAIFAVEYRYSGWRHLVPRASRESLLLAKLAAFILFAALSLVLAVLGQALVTILVPLARGMWPVIADATSTSAGILILCFLTSLAELMTLGAMVALVATATRSAMGAIIAPFLLSLAASMAESYFGGSGAAIPLPTFAGDAMRLWIVSATPSPELGRSALIGLATLIGWTAGSFGLAIAIFSRQDLVSE